MQKLSERSNLIIIALLLGAVLSACSKGPGRDVREREFDGLARAGDYAEIGARVQVYEDQGETGALYDYYRGVSQLRRNQDRQAQLSLEKAIAADSSYALRAAGEYRECANADAEHEWMDRGTRRMRRAYLLDGLVDMGTLTAPVAKSLFDDRAYAAAIPVYRFLLESGGGEEDERQRWRLRLGASLEMVGLPEAGLAEYRRYWELWPWQEDSTWRNYVMWRYQIVLMDRAEAAIEALHGAEAMRDLEEALAPKSFPEHMQRGRLLAGRAQELLGNPRDALGWYEQVMMNAKGEGGGEVEDARDRIEALRATGTY